MINFNSLAEINAYIRVLEDIGDKEEWQRTYVALWECRTGRRVK